MNYRVKKDIIILESWSEFSKIRRQLKKTRLTIIIVFNKIELFQRLLVELPESYNIIRNEIKILIDTSISEKLQIL